MILTTIALIAQATPASTASPASSDAEAKAAATAKAWFISLQHGKILDPTALDAEMSQRLTPELLTKFETQIGPLGDPQKFDQARTAVQKGSTFYLYDLTFKTGDMLKFVIVFDPNGKISGMQALPPQ